MKRKRTIAHVTYNTEKESWEAKIEGFPVFAWRDRSTVVVVMAGRMRLMEDMGYLGQVVVHNKTGIAFERTYGEDPRPTRG